ncbi:LisH/CRA/RING-U-box domains-containing protein [Euphorbia peplus]|nr:LisH/CRA/RING-U-box domains-containing protein [Euphorbia peplus]
MELSIVKDSFEHIAKKQKLSSSRSKEVTEQVSHEIEQALAKFQSTEDQTSLVDHKSILTDLRLKLNAVCPLKQFEGLQKELNVDLNRYVKLLEKTFNPDISKTYINIDFDCQTVNQILATHFYRQGLFDLGDCLMNEAGESEKTTLGSQFLELHQILDAIEVKNVEPALKWVSSNREKLNQNGSNLELKIHQLQYVEILKGGSKTDVMDYAKTHLSPLASLHTKEILMLMGSMCWIGKLESYPHSELLDPGNWAKLAEQLNQDFCNLLGQSYGNPLVVAITAGIEGLPTLLKLAEVMAIKKQDWKAMKQLPVPVELRKEYQFHSIFVCPVSREHGSEDNPPMLMPCMHVLCKQSIGRMSKGSSRSFKCPSCPAETSVSQCKQLFF